MKKIFILAKQKKTLLDDTSKYFSLIISTIVVVVLLGIFGFILYKSILGFQHYGIENILFSNKLDRKSVG